MRPVSCTSWAALAATGPGASWPRARPAPRRRWNSSLTPRRVALRAAGPGSCRAASGRAPSSASRRSRRARSAVRAASAARAAGAARGRGSGGEWAWRWSVGDSPRLGTPAAPDLMQVKPRAHARATCRTPPAVDTRRTHGIHRALPTDSERCHCVARGFLASTHRIDKTKKEPDAHYRRPLEESPSTGPSATIAAAEHTADTLKLLSDCSCGRSAAWCTPAT
jgi:hypothetical protein